MKRISMFLVAMLIMAGLDIKSQAPAGATTVLNYSGLESKLKKSDEDIQNVKKNTKAKTWTSRAEVFLDIYGVHNDILNKGMSPVQIKLFFKEPKEIQTKQDGPNKVDVYVYDRVDLKLVNDKLESWTEKNPIHPAPLMEAQKAIDEAVKLNADGKADSDIKKVVESLKKALEKEGIMDYEAQRFNESYEDFSGILKLNKLPQMNNKVDTVLIYFSGRAAYENKDYASANKLFEEAESYNLNDPLLYVFHKKSLFAAGDTAKGMDVLKKAFQKYPEDQSVLIDLINYYLESDQGEEALKLIAKAKAGDPSNISFTFTEASLLDKMGRTEEAIKGYNACITANPNYYNAYYNLGVIYYNRAVKLYEEASAITDNTLYEKKQAEADVAVKDAIPYMEKVSQMEVKNQGDFETKKSALETLRTIYYRLKMEDKRQEVINKLNSL